MIDTDDRMRWGTEQRLEFIEFRLFWEGSVNRADIIRRFGISTPQASNDLGLYRERAPGNIEYDSSRKRFVPSAGFVPKFLKLNADLYLAQLKGIADGMLRLEDTLLFNPPVVDAMPIPIRFVDPHLLKRIIAAVRERRSIEILYQSMNPKRPEPIWRRITPHAFSHDGFRWHIRAFCHTDCEHGDFILSRCREVRGEGEPGATTDADILWNSHFEVVLEPNPALAPSQRQAIALDYRMSDGRLRISVRRALLYYFNKRLRLDAAQKLDQPAETPLVVVNRPEFDAALKAVRT